MTLTAGTKLGPYEIADAIGAGGMSEVYRAVEWVKSIVPKTPASIASSPSRFFPIISPAERNCGNGSIVRHAPNWFEELKQKVPAGK